MVEDILLYLLFLFLGIILPWILKIVFSIGRILRFTFRGFFKVSWKYKHKVIWERFTLALDWEIRGAEVQ